MQRYAVRVARPGLVRVRRTYGAWRPGGKLPCDVDSYSTQEAGKCSPYIQCGGPVRDVRVSIADLLMIKPAPSFCDRGVNTFWIGLLAGAICYQGVPRPPPHATQVYPGA